MPCECGETVEVKDFHFKQMRKIYIKDFPDGLKVGSVNLLAVSNKFGLIFVGLSKGIRVFETVIIENNNDKESMKVDLEDFESTIIPLEGSPIHISLSCDDLTLGVCCETEYSPTLKLFDIKTLNFKNKTIESFLEYEFPSTRALQIYNLSWNPGISTVLAIGLTNDLLLGLEIKNDSFYQLGQLAPIATNSKEFESIIPTAFCWSPKGKQIVVGTNDGTLTQYTSAFQQTRVIPAPDFFETSRAVSSILWISNFQFVVSYHEEVNNKQQPSIVIVEVAKAGPVRYISFDDVCFASGFVRNPFYFLHYLPQWNILFCLSSNASETAILHGNPSTSNEWEQWFLEGTERAELPLVKNSETYSYGMALDLTAQKQIKMGDTLCLPPQPLFLVLSSAGLLCPFHVIYDPVVNTPIVKPPEKLISVGTPQPASIFSKSVKQIIPETAETQHSIFTYTNQDKSQIDNSIEVPSSNIASGFGAITFKRSLSHPTSHLVPNTSSSESSDAGQQVKLLDNQVKVSNKRLHQTNISRSSNQPIQPNSRITTTANSRLSSSSRMVNKPEIANANLFKTDRIITRKTAAPASLLQMMDQKNIGGDTFATSILEEVAAFQKELNELKMRNASCNFEVGSKEEMANLKKQIEYMRLFLEELKEIIASQNNEVHELKMMTLGSFHVVEEGSSRQQLQQDPCYIQLLRQRGLDPVCTRKMKEIRKWYQYLENWMKEVNHRLDLDWEEYEKKRKNILRKGPSSLDLIYSTLFNNQNIILDQSHRLEELVHELQQLNLHALPNWRHQNLNLPFNKDENQLSSLAESLIEQKSGSPTKAPSPIKSLSPEKQTNLRNLLEKRQIIPVRTAAPGNLSLSKTISDRLLQKQIETDLSEDELFEEEELENEHADFEEEEYGDEEDDEDDEDDELSDEENDDYLIEEELATPFKAANQQIPVQNITFGTGMSVNKTPLFGSSTETSFQGLNVFQSKISPVHGQCFPSTLVTFSENKPIVFSADANNKNLTLSANAKLLPVSNSESLVTPSTGLAKAQPPFTAAPVSKPLTTSSVNPISETTSTSASTFVFKLPEGFSMSDSLAQQSKSPSAFTFSGFKPPSELLDKPQPKKEEMKDQLELDTSVANGFTTSAAVPTQTTPKTLSVKVVTLAGPLAESKETSLTNNSEIKSSESVAVPSTNIPQIERFSESVSITPLSSIPIQISTEKKENLSPTRNTIITSSSLPVSSNQKAVIVSPAAVIPVQSTNTTSATKNLSVDAENTVEIVSTLPITSSEVSSPNQIPVSTNIVFPTVPPLIINSDSSDDTSGNDNASVESGSITTTASSTTSVFDQPISSSNIFGQPVYSQTEVSTTSTFDQPTTVTTVFGQPISTTSAGSVFGQSVPVGFNQTNPSVFNQSSVFGQHDPPINSSVFTSVTTASLFGQPSATTITSIFGQPSTTSTSVFGQSSTSSASVFGQPSTTSTTGFGQVSTTSTNVFGQPSTTSTNIFGQPANPSFGFGTQSVFGQYPASNSFKFTLPTATTTSSGNFVFGQSNSGTNFGNFGQNRTSAFGQNANVYGQSSSPSAGSNVFGQSFFGGLGEKPSQENANKNVFGSSSSFGSSSPTNNLFGNTGASGFGTSHSGSGTEGSFSNVQQKSVAQTGFAVNTGSPSSGFMTTSAFGGGPVFGTKPLSFSPPSSAPSSVFGSSLNQNPGFSSLANANTPTFGSLVSQNIPTFGSLSVSPNTPGFMNVGGSAFGSPASFGGGTGGPSFSSSTGFGSPSQPASFSQWR